MDFVADGLFDGRRFRALAVVDNFTKQSLAIEIDQQLKGEDVVNVTEHLKHQHGLPLRIRTDNDSELTPWQADRQPFIESFNRSFRDKCLNTHWFLSLT
jgi:putative transposase